MYTKTTKINVFVGFLFLISLTLTSCEAIPFLGGVIPVSPGEADVEPMSSALFGPEDARDAALEFVQDHYGSSGPSREVVWKGGEGPINDMTGSSTFRYLTGGWEVKVSFPITAPETTIYTISINSSGEHFSWEGLVDSFGQVATTIISIGSPSPTPTIISPTETDEPKPVLARFQDETYKISLEYPVDWTLKEIHAGQVAATGRESKVLQFVKEDWVLNIHYKYNWENTVLGGGGMGAGEIISRGYVNLFGKLVPEQVLVYDGQKKVIFFGDVFEYLEFFVRLDEDLMGYKDYSSVDIPDHIISEMEKISSSIVQTGDVIPPPTPTHLPTPTPEPTPTPKPIPCNAAKFVSDETVLDGTSFAPGTDFTKVWRLENMGTCSWTTRYDMVFFDGNRMGGAKVTALPEIIRPGEQVDLSVSLTAPSEAGEYSGYWMLRSDDGDWFGLGSDTNKSFWVSINVVAPRGDYTYDYALKVCSAAWHSESKRLDCGYSEDVKDGFVKLMEEPDLEIRHENELALWVHPNEEHRGWIEGTYPYFRIAEGDRFKAWVGCLDGFNKCSLKFYLEYADKDGRIHRLGEWVEEYDGEVTILDIDLSELAGQSIQIILGMEALTKNVDAAQGFWFVPRIE